LRIFKVVKEIKSFRDIKTVIEKPRKKIDAIKNSRPKKLRERVTVEEILRSIEMATIRSPKEPKGRSDGIMSDDDTVRTRDKTKKNANAQGEATKSDELSRETRRMTGRKAGVMQKTPGSSVIEAESSANPNVARPDATETAGEMLRMITDLHKQLASLTDRLDSDEGKKTRDEPKTKEVEKEQPPDEQKVSKVEQGTVKEDQEQIRSLTQMNTQMVPYGYPPFRLPLGGWLISPFQELKYSGRETDLNPVAFLKRYENIASREGVDQAEKLMHFPRCLTGSAANWYDAYDFTSYEEMKSLFLQRFWNESIQMRVRQQMYMGKYDPGKRKTATEYVLELSRLAKSLDSPMTDKEFIACISRHFDAETALMIRPGVIRTLPELVEYLTHVDTMKHYEKTEGQTKAKRDKSTDNRKRNEPRTVKNNTE